MFFKRAKKSEEASSPAPTTAVFAAAAAEKPSTAAALDADKLRRVTVASKLGFKTTADVARSAAEPFEARRVWDTLKSTLAATGKPPAHVFISGPPGCGALRAVTAHLAGLPQAIDANAADWLFVLDEKADGGWRAIPVPAGQGKRLAAGITAVVAQLRGTLPYLLKGEDLSLRRASIEAGFSAVRDEAFSRLREMAHVQNVAVLTTPMGFAVAPMHEGKVVKPEVLARLPQAMRDEVRRKVESVEAELQTLLADVPSEAGSQIGELVELTADYLRPAVKAGLEGLTKEFSSAPEAMAFLNAMQEDVLRRACRDGAGVSLPDYCGRVLEGGGKSIVSVDWTVGSGALAEAALRAGKGAVVIDAARLDDDAWAALKRAAETRLVALPGLHGQTQPVAATFVLVADEPVVADPAANTGPAAFGTRLSFASQAARSEESESALARLLAVAADDRGLRPLEAAAVAHLIAEAASATGRPDRLSGDLTQLVLLATDADRIAASANRSAVTEADVIAALAERRSGGSVQPLFAPAANEITGRVLALGLASEPVEVWATVRPGQGTVADFARATAAAHETASSASAMLWSLIAARYVPTQRLSLAAAIVHEPPVSAAASVRASAAEAFALLSALAEAPIPTSFAVAGWVSPSGALLPLAGVNAAIEGAFDHNGGREAAGPLRILIPRANEADLMLRADLVDAVRKGKLQIYAAADIDEGLSLLTGIKAGTTSDAAGEPSLNRQIEERLTAFAKQSATADAASPLRKAPA